MRLPRVRAHILASMTVLVVVSVPAGLWAQGSLPAACAAFTDDPMNAGTPARAVHIAALRECVGVLRDSTGLAPFAWTDPTLVPGVTPVRAVHLAQLRRALGEAYAAEGLDAPAYTDTTLVAGGTEIKRLQVTELRAAARALGLANAPPVISGPGNQTHPAATAVSVAVVASDPEGAALTYAAVGLPAGLGINPATGLISGILPNDRATYSVIVSAYDGVLFGRRAFSWAVTLNHAPVVSGPSLETQLEGTTMSTQVVAGDADGDPLMFSAIGLPAGLAIDATTGIIAGTLTSGTFGHFAPAVSVSDGTASTTFTIPWTVIGNVDAKIWDSFTGTTGTDLRWHLPEHRLDGEFWWYGAGGGTRPTLQANRVGLAPDSGVTIWQLYGGTYDAIVAADISSTSPTPYGGLALRVVDSNNYFVLTLPGPSLYRVVDGQWTFLGQPATSRSIVAGQEYRLEARLIDRQIQVFWNGALLYYVNDSTNQGASHHGLFWNTSQDASFQLDNFEISVPNTAPTVTVPADQLQIEGASASLQVGAADGEGTPLIFSATGLPAGMSINPATGVIGGTLASGSAGVHAVGVSVSDGVMSASGVFEWRVLHPAATLIYDTFNNVHAEYLTNHHFAIGPSGLAWHWLRGLSIPTAVDGQVHTGDSPQTEAWTTDVGLADVTLSVDVHSADATPYGGLVLRASDANNYLLLRYQGPHLYRRVNGNYQEVAEAHRPFNAGESHRLEVQAVGDQIDVYSDGVPLLSATEPFNQAATRHGIQWDPIEDSTLTFDNFELRSDRSISSIPSYGCETVVSPTSMTVNSEKGTYALSVSAEPGCLWSFQSDSDIIDEGGRSVDGITFSIQNNTYAEPRTVRLSVGEHTVTITQLGVASPSGCSYAVTPASMNVEAANGSGHLAVVSQPGCAWTAVNPDGFVHIDGGSAGSGTGVVAFTFDDNTTPAARSSVFDVAGHYVTVTQPSVAAGGCQYSILPTLPLEGGDSSEIITVTAPTGCAWSATSDADFIQVSGSVTGNGSGTVIATATANPDHQMRSGTLRIAGQEITLFQSGSGGEPFCVSALTPSSLSLPAIGGQGIVAVSASSGCQWSVSSGVSWLNLSQLTGGRFAYAVGPNPGDERAILVTVGPFELPINQGGATPTGITGADVVWQAPRTEKVPDRCLGNCGAGCGTFLGVCGGGHWSSETLSDPQFLGNVLQEVCSAGQKQLGVFPQYSAMVKWTYHGIFSVACWAHDATCRTQRNPLNWIFLVKDIWCGVAVPPVAPVVCTAAVPRNWSYSELEVGRTLFPTSIITNPDAPSCGQPEP